MVILPIITWWIVFYCWFWSWNNALLLPTQSLSTITTWAKMCDKSKSSFFSILRSLFLIYCDFSMQVVFCIFLYFYVNFWGKSLGNRIPSANMLCLSYQIGRKNSQRLPFIPTALLGDIVFNKICAKCLFETDIRISWNIFNYICSQDYVGLCPQSYNK